LKTGFYRGVPFEDYVAWDAANSHGLQTLIRQTPAHLRYELDHGGTEETEALAVGHLLHVAVLEPESWARGYVVAPHLDRRTKAGKAALAAFEAEHQDATVVAPERHALVSAMAAALLAHPTAKEILAGPGVSELSLLWEEGGMPCKARLDRVGQLGAEAVIGDVKTCTDASRRTFERSVHTYGYHIQAAHYIAGAEAVVPQPAGNPRRRFLYICVEKTPPHCVAVYEIDDFALGEGDVLRRRALRAWMACRESGDWPGYGAGADIVSIPQWAIRSFDDAPEI
jgi:exodeoxyribonuclease VIII